ncbi:MAG TPA: peptidylprolyl isomerase [Candidatus Ozemobacteraceae bacterium]|nr:peptidylprolyl isomerase [Candidatus Ozemobacteraceae bacterium]
MKTAVASHILVSSEAECNELKKTIELGVNFAKVAKEHSKCPSGKNGGSLGSFGQGDMVPEFDKIVFSGELQKVHGPVKTQFGYHLIWIESRNE